MDVEQGVCDAIAVYKKDGHRGIAVERREQWFGLTAEDTAYLGDLDSLLAQGADLAEVAASLASGTPVDLDAVRILPPFGRPNKIICIGLNYLDHSTETGFAKQTYSTVFARFASH